MIILYCGHRIEIAADVLAQSTGTGSVKNTDSPGIELDRIVDIVHYSLDGLIGAHTADIYLGAEIELTAAARVRALRSYIAHAAGRSSGLADSALEAVELNGGLYAAENHRCFLARNLFNGADGVAATLE